jgi:DNA-directed RNA polymerase subunit RPC12/RpoP
VLRFSCPNCGAKLTGSEERAGKAAVCPRCKRKLTVPPAPELTLLREEPAAPVESSDRPTFRAPPAPVERDSDRREHEQAREVLASLGPEAAPEHTGERKLPWLLDILLYPFSTTGIVTLVVMIGFPLVRTLFDAFAPRPRVVPMRGWPSFLIGLVLGLYVLWYLAECVHDSAQGGTRAPDVLDANTGLSNLWARVSYLLAVYIVYGMPVVIYGLATHRLDPIFWALAAWAAVFFPMSLLAMVVNDSISALNPLFLIGSICRVPLSYFGLIVCLLAMAVLFVLVPALMRPTPPPGAVGAIGLVSLLAGAYGSFLFAHVLGRFYWRNRDRLDWGL